MSPAAIIARAETLGLTLVPDGDHIRVRGPREAIQELTPLLKQRKPEILAVLAAPANEPVTTFRALPVDGLVNGITQDNERIQMAQDGLDQDLEALIRHAGIFYEYSPDDFDLLRNAARRDPAGIRLALEADPLQPFYSNHSS